MFQRFYVVFFIVLLRWAIQFRMNTIIWLAKKAIRIKPNFSFQLFIDVKKLTLTIFVSIFLECACLNNFDF